LGPFRKREKKESLFFPSYPSKLSLDYGRKAFWEYKERGVFNFKSDLMRLISKLKKN